MKLLVTGAAGMLGQRVVQKATARDWEAVGIDLPDADLTDAQQALDVITGHRPDVIIHCAAYTNVDEAEAHEDVAMRVNRDASAHVAAAATACGARVVAVSTDYVFDGMMSARPPRGYLESDPTSPLGAYGRTKYAGELAIVEGCENHAIARTAWLYGAGGKNFCDTMLGLAADRDAVSVVTDQVGSPTWTGHLVPALLDLAASESTGVFHTAGGGQCSWHGLTTELFNQAEIDCKVEETTSTQFVRPAPRPSWSVLDSERDGPRLPSWQLGVLGFLAERKATA